MAYMNSEKKAIISANLKPVLKKFGIKGTLSIRDRSSIVLTLKSGKIDFNSDCASVNPYYVNPYWFHEHYEGIAKKFLMEAFDALKSANWYDKSDAHIDYFDTAYYIDVNVGKWNKPYMLET